MLRAKEEVEKCITCQDDPGGSCKYGETADRHFGIQKNNTMKGVKT